MAITTKEIPLPSTFAGDIVKHVQDTSVVQTLSQGKPMVFGNEASILFTTDPEADILADGDTYGNSTPTTKVVNTTTRRIAVTYRVSKDVDALAEDSKVQLLEALAETAGAAIGRGLDYMVFHGVNPSTGAALSNITGLCAGATAVTTTGGAEADLDALVAACNGSDYDITGLAMSKKFAADLRNVRIKSTGTRMYPEIPINLKAAAVDGVPAVTAASVNGKRATAPTNVLAIMGDFNLVKWGIVRDLNMDVITMGDPDGLGDLKKLGQVAYRLEAVMAAAVLDPKGFAVLKSE